MSVPGEIDDYTLDNESVSYTLTYRPTGFTNWLKSVFGIGVTNWYLTNQRLIEHTSITGGFTFEDVALDKVSSVQYGSKLNIPLLVLGALLTVLGLVALTETPTVGILSVILGIGFAAYSFWRRGQTLAVHASGGVTLQLQISKGQQVDEFLWYLHAERQKARDN